MVLQQYKVWWRYMSPWCGAVRGVTVWQCDGVSWLTFHNFIFPAGWSDVLYSSRLTNYSTLSLPPLTGWAEPTLTATSHLTPHTLNLTPHSLSPQTSDLSPQTSQPLASHLTHLLSSHYYQRADQYKTQEATDLLIFL